MTKQVTTLTNPSAKQLKNLEAEAAAAAKKVAPKTTKKASK